jgi:hypothetical protein
MSGPVISGELNGWAAKLAFAATVGVLAVGLAACAIDVGIVGYFGDSADPGRVERAVRLDRNNPRWHFRLGQLYGWSELDGAKAVSHLRQAIALNPEQAPYWAGLGWTCLAANELECSSSAFRKAVQLAPMRPQSHWNLVNYLSIAGTEREMLAEMGSYLRLNQRLERPDAQPGFRLYQRAFGNLDGMWGLLNQDAELAILRMPLLNFAAVQAQGGWAVRRWDELAVKHAEIPLSEASQFIQKLIAGQQYEDAAHVWQDLQSLGVVRGATGDDQVYNGGFEQAHIEAPFDWQTKAEPYIYVDLLGTPGHDGQHCLQIDYTTADNSETDPVYEFVPVQPNQRYRVSAYVRSNAITSDSGPRLRLSDPECAECAPTTTEGTTGTTDWHQLSIEVTTGPSQHVALLSVWRPHSRTFPMEITGTFWVDSVSMRAAPTSSAQSAGTIAESAPGH